MKTLDDDTRLLEEIDLTAITSDKTGMICTVKVDVDFRWKPWLKLGTVSLLAAERDPRLPWRLEARTGDGSTDYEHSGCFVVRLPLVGVGYEFTNDGGSHFHAWIAPKPDDFRVAPVGWDPGHAKGSSACSHCKDDDKHRVCPQGSWMPPKTPDLFELVKMRAVQIWIGPDYSREG